MDLLSYVDGCTLKNRSSKLRVFKANSPLRIPYHTDYSNLMILCEKCVKKLVELERESDR